MEPNGPTDRPAHCWVEETFTVEVPMVRPKPLFLEILRLAGATGEVFTKDEIINYLRIYIKDRQLYDVNHPRIVHCSTDLLGAVFGVEKFAAEDVLKILEDNIIYTQDTCLKTKKQLVKKTLPFCNKRETVKFNKSASESSLTLRENINCNRTVTETESFSDVRDNLKQSEKVSKIETPNVKDHIKNSGSELCQSLQISLKRDNLKTTKSLSETECCLPSTSLKCRDHLKISESVSETTSESQVFSVTSTSNQAETDSSSPSNSLEGRDHLKIIKSAPETQSSQSSNLDTERECLKTYKTMFCYPSPSCSQTTKELSSSETDVNCLSEVSVSSLSVSSGNSGSNKKRKRRKRKANVIAVCPIPKFQKKDDADLSSKQEKKANIQPRPGPSISISRCSSGEYIYDVQVKLRDDNDDDDDDGNDVFFDGDVYQGSLTEGAYDVDRVWYLNEGYVEEDLTSEPPFSESDLSSIRSGEDLLVVCQDSDVEFFADCSDSASNSDDKELTEADNWICVDCQLSNPPYQRFCNKCWKHRPDWLPITPKTLGSLPSSGEVETVKSDKAIQPTDFEWSKVSSGFLGPLLSEKPGLYEIRRSFSNLQSKALSIGSSETQGSSQENVKVPQVPLDDPCIICLAKPKTASLIHGNSGHQVCCFSCARQLKNQGKVCPVCRRPINKVVKNYIL